MDEFDNFGSAPTESINPPAGDGFDIFGGAPAVAQGSVDDDPFAQAPASHDFDAGFAMPAASDPFSQEAPAASAFDGFEAPAGVISLGQPEAIAGEDPFAAAPPPFDAAPPTHPEPAAMSAADFKKTPLGVWNTEFEALLTQRQAKEDAKRTAIKHDADSFVEKFRTEQKAFRDKKAAENRKAETLFIDTRKSELSAGSAWDQVCSLCEMQIKPDRRDTTRLRNVLFAVKDHPPKAPIRAA